jgi:spore germination cell wall hydrolase CwlJ-like protein
LGGRGRRISEFEASLVYKVSSRTARATQRSPVSKTTTTKKKKKKRKKEKKRKERKKETLMEHIALLEFRYFWMHCFGLYVHNLTQKYVV